MSNVKHKPFGDFVRNRRKQREMTQDQLAAAVRVSQPTISEWERGLVLPDGRDRMLALAQALDVPPDHLADAMGAGVIGHDDEVIQAIWQQHLLTRDERNALILVYKRFLAGRDQVVQRR